MRNGASIASIRKDLHRSPELSGKEKETAKFIKSFFKGLSGFEISDFGSHHSFLVSKRYGPGGGIGFRAELDGLPIAEVASHSHSSESQGRSHACGHDGHMSVLLALAEKLEGLNTSHGTVYFIFQSAEETGEGATAIVETGVLQKIDFDAIYALHNIPGFPLGEVFCKVGSFACASVGCEIEIEGRTAHAAHPENSINPLEAAIELLESIKLLPAFADKGHNTILTPIALNSGIKSYGTSPVNASLIFTFRTEETQLLNELRAAISEMVSLSAERRGTKNKLRFEEYFPATANDAVLVANIKAVTGKMGVRYTTLSSPFRWSEDFGSFGAVGAVLLFGLGSGENSPQLHAPDYDFPDVLLERGSDLFLELYNHHNS